MRESPPRAASRGGDRESPPPDPGTSPTPAMFLGDLALPAGTGAAGVRFRRGVEAEAVEARIREIDDSIRLLRELTSRPFDSLGLHEILAMRYLIIQLVEAASGACLHLLASVGERAEGYPNCFARMGELGIISSDLALRLAAAARLRNLLVHRYWTVSDLRVYESVREGLGDFEEFAAALREIVDRGIGEG